MERRTYTVTEAATVLGISRTSAYERVRAGDLPALRLGRRIVITRAVQRWLEQVYLPATDLDAGLRNSISTVSGYCGFLLALALAFSYLGLSLEKLTIVAGALSVGIGFGLQSIVNNFVSGLLLLWERPIRVGDQVLIGDSEGIVKRISVRSTEIQTFDRSAVIVPNSNLISGIVKNRVRGDRTGRVSITVSVLRNQDPVRAAELLMNCAQAQPDVLKEPPPRATRALGRSHASMPLRKSPVQAAPARSIPRLRQRARHHALVQSLSRCRTTR
jgi:excisionase family DNA binding protein